VACRGKSWCRCRGCVAPPGAVSPAERTRRVQNMRSVMRDPRQRYQRIKYLKSQNRGLTGWPGNGTLALENGKGGEGGLPVFNFDRTRRLIELAMTTRKAHPPGWVSANPG